MLKEEIISFPSGLDVMRWCTDIGSFILLFVHSFVPSTSSASAIADSEVKSQMIMKFNLY